MSLPNGLLSVTEALRCGRQKLEVSSSSPELDAQVLLGSVLGLSRLQLVVEPLKRLSAVQQEMFLAFINRRAQSEPVAYITGTKEFWGLDFFVTPDVLVPRPDTELLVEMALTVSAEFSDPMLVLDLGTGSGCLPVALLFELKRRSRKVFMLAADASLAALKVAQRNIVHHEFTKDIELVCGNWSDAIAQDFDLVISNPPYLERDDKEISRELGFEPQQALYAGLDGLDDYRKIFRALPTLLSSQGVFLGEIGYGQAPAIEALAKNLLPHPQVDFHYDLRRIQRVVEIRLPPG